MRRRHDGVVAPEAVAVGHGVAGRGELAGERGGVVEGLAALHAVANLLKYEIDKHHNLVVKTMFYFESVPVDLSVRPEHELGPLRPRGHLRGQLSAAQPISHPNKPSAILAVLRNLRQISWFIET